MQWELITNIILAISIITLAIFAILGLYQWITRKSIKKVDIQLLWMLLPLILMVITYFVFDKLIIVATRPNGSGEPSFPSTHVMVVTTIFFITTIILPKYIKSNALRIALEFMMIIMISLTCVGRIYSNMHTPVDVIAALAFAFVFSEIYFVAIRQSKKQRKTKKLEA
ncbi:phosphatase PAP2 family protein [Candidatus Saccharibacteria bacterium]|nr:phosphatase PAP2 family protein [Candidatus Saccharibacteria bacterium]